MDRRAAILEVLARHSGGFAYGSNDCCQLALDIVRALRGHAPEPPVYDTEEAAYAFIAQFGGLERMVTTLLEQQPTDARPNDGDIVLCDLPLVGEAMGVWCDGNPVVLSTHGLVKVSALRARATWAIG